MAALSSKPSAPPLPLPPHLGLKEVPLCSQCILLHLELHREESGGEGKWKGKGRERGEDTSGIKNGMSTLVLYDTQTHLSFLLLSSSHFAHEVVLITVQLRTELPQTGHVLMEGTLRGKGWGGGGGGTWYCFYLL